MLLIKLDAFFVPYLFPNLIEFRSRRNIWSICWFELASPLIVIDIIIGYFFKWIQGKMKSWWFLVHCFLGSNVDFRLILLISIYLFDQALFSQVFIELSNDLTDGTTWALTITVLTIRFTSSQQFSLQIAANLCVIGGCNYLQGRDGNFNLDYFGNQETNIILLVWIVESIEVYFVDVLLWACWMILLLLFFWSWFGIDWS